MNDMKITNLSMLIRLESFRKSNELNIEFKLEFFNKLEIKNETN